MVINTGTPRSVTGHALSGAFVSLLFSGARHYHKVKQGEITPQEAVSRTTKDTLQGGVITAAAIAASNALGEQDSLNGSLKAIAWITAGALASYAIHTLPQGESEEPCPQETALLTTGENHE